MIYPSKTEPIKVRLPQHLYDKVTADHANVNRAINDMLIAKIREVQHMDEIPDYLCARSAYKCARRATSLRVPRMVMEYIRLNRLNTTKVIEAAIAEHYGNERRNHPLLHH